MTMNNNRGGRVVGPHLDPLIWRSSGNGPDRLKETREVDEENGLPVSLYFTPEGTEEATKVGPGAGLPVAGVGVFQVGGAAAHFDTGQTALSTTAAQILAGRTSRRRVVFKNIDTAITVYIGPIEDGIVTSSNGLPLLPGESFALQATGSVWAIAASGTPTLAWVEEFD